MTFSDEFRVPAPPKAVRIPSIFKKSPFMKKSRGFAIYSGLPSTRVVSKLCKEARSLFCGARNQETWEYEPNSTEDIDFEKDRDQSPRRRKRNVAGGPAQVALYHDPRLLSFLSTETGMQLEQSGGRGSYTYYARPGDFIGLHRDANYCDVVMITVLEDNSDPSDPSGALVLYPDRTNESLSAIQATPKKGAELFKLIRGQTLLMFGGVIPHRVFPTRQGQRRVISALCFRALHGSG